MIEAIKVNGADPTPSIIAIVNEDNRGASAALPKANGQGSSYNAMNDGTQTTTVNLAQVPRNVLGFISGGFQIANTTGSNATCTITYSGVPAATESGVVLLANSSIIRFAPNVANLTDGFNASASVTCTQPIVGISNFQVSILTAIVSYRQTV